MRKISKGMFVVALTCLLGTGGVVYFAGCAAAEELLDGGGLKDVGRSDAGGEVCTPACEGKACGDDGCEGSCGSCAATEDCKEGKCEPKTTGDCTGKFCGDDDGNNGKCKACANAGETCNETTWVCETVPTGCVGKTCGDDDGNGGKCKSCPNVGETCNETTWVCEVANDCTGKKCGELGTDGTTKCEGACDDPAASCINGPAWECSTCDEDCTDKNCGDSNGCGGKCVGKCPNAGEICDQATYTCIANPCEGKNCGDTAGGYLCMGACPNAGEECKVDPADPTKVKCMSCNQNGAASGVSCADQGVCKCGNDCVKLFQDDAECLADPAKCQKTGMCLEDCFSTGTCTDTTQLCACTKGDAAGSCIAGDCFATGTVKGNFSGKVLNSCSDQPAQTDIGQGNMTATVPGKSATFNMFIACHYTTGQDLVLVQGLKACGTQICPDVMILAVETAKLKVGTLQFKDGGLIAEWDQYTFSGQTVSEVWIRGLGIDGSLTFTQVGTTGKAPIAGTADVKLIKYDYESCGPNSGPCN